MMSLLTSLNLGIKQQMRLSIITILLLCAASSALATHNRAGEITYEQIGPLSIRATITTYTKTSSVAADRDSLELFWGDGTSQWIRRSNGNGEPLPNDIKYNIYVAEHTYPGVSTYIMSMTDPNRNGGILNVNFPNSDAIRFHLETRVTLLNTQFQGLNNSPVLLQPPVDIGCVGQPFIHNPNAFDPDGDSLAYELIVPLQDVDVEVTDYQFPSQIGAGPDNIITLNEKTGDFIWDSPQVPGEYNIAILIKEYRGGALLNTIIRDMQITIRDCDNRPPEIETVEEICVIAGELIDFDVIVTDPDINPQQQVALTAGGGPFLQDISPAQLIVDEGFQPQPLVGRFRWQTTCEHVTSRPYVVVFKAEDNFFNGQLGSSTLKRVEITIIGPPPENFDVETFEETAILEWDYPYACTFTENDFFQGFSIWRRNSSNPFEIDSCAPTMEGKGYTRIQGRVNDFEDDRYVFIDNTIEKGLTYCYRVVPEFALLSPAGNPFNIVEGIPSDEKCVQLNQDVPIITNVDVLETSEDQGVIEVKWVKPIYPDLDTVNFPGPYEYRVFRGSGINQDNYEPIDGAVFFSETFEELSDSMYIDSFLNTANIPYTYQIEFYTGEQLNKYGETNPASSIFLNIVSTDRRNILSWDFRVPWENFNYEIYRENNDGVFELIGETDETTYTDRRLNNGEEYCYFIRSFGTYGIDRIESPLINNSQIDCGIPIDTVPPCPPELTVDNDCEAIGESIIDDELFNRLTWTNPAIICGEDSEDVNGYNIYYAPPPGNEFQLIITVESPDQLDYMHNSEFGLAGCYAITSLDFNGNESEFSNIICPDNCPLYILPNTFTPNGDGFNDIFIPIVNRFIAQVEFKVYNVWGNLVYETNNPELNWNGQDQSGTDLAEGTYYYTCTVFETRNEGIIPQQSALNGYIELIR